MSLFSECGAQRQRLSKTIHKNKGSNPRSSETQQSIMVVVVKEVELGARSSTSSAMRFDGDTITKLPSGAFFQKNKNQSSNKLERWQLWPMPMAPSRLLLREEATSARHSHRHGWHRCLHGGNWCIGFVTRGYVAAVFAIQRRRFIWQSNHQPWLVVNISH